MRSFKAVYGGLLGAVPGLILVSVSGELLGLLVVGMVLIPSGLVVGSIAGWRESHRLNSWGMVGGLIGVVPGIIMMLFDPDIRIVLNDPLVILRWDEVVTLALVVGFPVGVFTGNRVGRSARRT